LTEPTVFVLGARVPLTQLGLSHGDERQDEENDPHYDHDYAAKYSGDDARVGAELTNPLLEIWHFLDMEKKMRSGKKWKKNGL